MQQLQTNLLLSCNDDDQSPLCEDIYAHLALQSNPASIPITTATTTPIWYREFLSRDGAKRLLKFKEEGSFIVRKSAKRDCFALSLVVVPSKPSVSRSKQAKVIHYLIEQTSLAGFRIKGFEKEFQSLQALVTHHSVMKEKLPVVLRLERSKENLEMNNNHLKRVEDYDNFEDLDSLIKQLNLSQFNM